MSIAKPFTFVAGQKARANEVNADFDALYSQVNINIADIAQINRDVDSIESTKADINGNSTQRFAVANPVNSTDAVNKQTMTKSLTNVLDYINGLKIEKDSASPNDTILVNPGSCYDSTKQVVLELANITSKKNEGQGASTTYYVYIVGNETGSSIDIIISNSSIEPTLPTGYTKFRKIGSFTTNSSNNIDTINSYSNDINSIVHIIQTYINGNSGYRIWSDGYCEQWGRNGAGGTTATAYFLKHFRDTRYSLNGLAYGEPGGIGNESWFAVSLQKDYFTFYTIGGPNSLSWRACGYLAEGEY